MGAPEDDDTGSGAAGAALEGTLRLVTLSAGGRLRRMVGGGTLSDAIGASLAVSAARTGAGGATGQICAHATAGAHADATAIIRNRGKRGDTTVLRAFQHPAETRHADG